MGDWCPADASELIELDYYVPYHQVESEKLPDNLPVKSQSQDFPKNHLSLVKDPRLIRSEGNNSPRPGTHFKEKVKKRPPNILELPIRDQLRLSGITSQSYLSLPKPVNYEFTPHGRMNRLASLAISSKLFTSSEVKEEVSTNDVEERATNHQEISPKKTRSSASSVDSDDYDFVLESTTVEMKSTTTSQRACSVTSIQSNPFLPNFCDPYM